MKTPFVVDASVACSWYFPSQKLDITDKLLQDASLVEIVVPPIFIEEVNNALSRRSFPKQKALSIISVFYNNRFCKRDELSIEDRMTAYRSCYWLSITRVLYS